MREDLTLELIPYAVVMDPDVEYKRVLAAPKGQMDYVKRGLYLQILMPRSEDRTKPDDPHPIVVYAVGGGWKIPMTRQRLPGVVELAAKGFVVAVTEYRGREYFNSWREAVSDVRSAVRYMRRHGAEYNGDPDRIVLFGDSAGGHLAALAAYSGEEFDDPGDDLRVSAKVSGIMTIFAPTDPRRVLKEALDGDLAVNPAAGHMIEALKDVVKAESVEEALEKLPELSVLNRVRPGVDLPPTLIAQGDKDPLVPVWCAEELYESLTAAGHDAELYLLHGARHGDMRFYGDDMVERYSRFIRRCTGE